MFAEATLISYEEIEFRVDEDAILQYHFIAFFKEWHSKSDYQRPVQMIKQAEDEAFRRAFNDVSELGGNEEKPKILKIFDHL